MQLALYPGSFDPLTLGHLDIIKRSCNIFDKVLVGVINNPNKKGMFSLEKRQELIQQVAEAENLAHKIEVDSFDGLLVNYIQSKNINVVIRGLRAVTDFEYELALSLMNKELLPELETIFLMSSHQYSFVSSNLMKEVFKYGGDISRHVHPIILQEMKKLAEQQ